MLDPVGHHVQCERCRLDTSFGFGRAIGQHPRQIGDFADPPAVFLALYLDFKHDRTQLRREMSFRDGSGGRRTKPSSDPVEADTDPHALVARRRMGDNSPPIPAKRRAACAASDRTALPKSITPGAIRALSRPATAM